MKSSRKLLIAAALIVGAAALSPLACQSPVAQQIQGLVALDSVETRSLAPPEVPTEASPYQPVALSKARAAALDERLDRGFQESGVRGVSVALWKPGAGLWRGARGLSGPDRPFDPDDLCHAASMGKVATAALIFQEIEAGRLTLDRDLSAFLPQHPRARELTLDQLLRHTAGLPPIDWPDASASPDPLAELDRLLAAEDLLFAPGSAWSYCNPGYVLLGELAARSAGKPFQALLRERVIEKLGLRGARVLSPELDLDDARFAWSYDRGPENPSRDLKTWCHPRGAGALALRPIDAIALLHGILAGKLVNQESLTAMLADAIPTGGPRWGRGLMVLDSPLGPVIYLAGRIRPGFGSAAGYLLSRQTYFAVMINDATPPDPFWFLLLKDPLPR